MKVYLAGPIKGLSYVEATDWRDYATDILGRVGIECLSPMRHKDYLKGTEVLFDFYEDHPLSTTSGIVTRDYTDVSRSDALLVNFLNAETVSIGTVWEMGVAYALKIPIVLVRDDNDLLHYHPMVNESARFGYTANTVRDGIAFVATLLNRDARPHMQV